MIHNQWMLLRRRRFLPLFITQVLGAFNDNVFKNAFVVLIAFSLASDLDQFTGIGATVWVNIVAGLFILPFCLFSGLAGFIADHVEKSRAIRWIKGMECVLMIVAAVGFLLNDSHSMASFGVLMVVLILMGTQSAFFGPFKYSILLDHLNPNELIGGNAMISFGTFLSILLGTLIGGGIILLDSGAGYLHGSACVSGIVIFFSILGFVSSFSIPKAESVNEPVQFRLFLTTFSAIRSVFQQRRLVLSMLGISWFWFLGAIFLAQFPAFSRLILGGSENVMTLLIMMFSMGVAIGSLCCNRLLKGFIRATFVPVAALGISIFAIDLYFASCGVQLVIGSNLGVVDVLSSRSHIRVLFDVFMIGVSGGLYYVPLFAIVQSEAEAGFCSRAIAINNILNALFMVGSAIVGAGILYFFDFIPIVFLLAAGLNLIVGVYICFLLPDALPRSILHGVLKFIYKVEVRGLEHLKDVGDRVLIVANHTSLLDAVLLAVFIPERLTFVVDTFVAKKWWVKLWFFMVDVVPLDPTNPMATKTLTKLVAEGKKCVIFPEGRITVTGSLMKVNEGPGLILDKADAFCLPVRIDGAQYSHFSYLKGKVRIRWFPSICLTILEPRKFNVEAGVKGRVRRKYIANELYTLMTTMMLQSTDMSISLFSSLLNARQIHGSKKIVLEDMERKPISYRRLIVGAFVLGMSLASQTTSREKVGVLLPNSIAVVVTFFGLQAFGRVPAMLNFSVGSASVVSACRTILAQNVITSRRFVELAELEDLIEAIEAEGIKVIYLEDVKSRISIFGKMVGFLASYMPRMYYAFCTRKELREPDDTAVVLFTSGSEGAPKAVLLSHCNIRSNCTQISSVIDFGPQDVVFNVLPLFHSFGLTAATLLSLFSGIKVFLYPSPLHFRWIPGLVYLSNATILFGTSRFLSGYGQSANPYDFYSLRYVFAGAEKLQESVRQMWADKFGLRILEGYGATEASPVLSLNTPMYCQYGSVGRLMPGIDYKLIPVSGIENGGELWVKGPNIMKGYMKIDRPGQLEPLPEPYYCTGDIVEIDNDGFVTIKGRLKRFAKVGGEMVSLTAVEGLISKYWPDVNHAMIARMDDVKGEQLVLLTEHEGINKKKLVAYFQQEGMSELGVPKDIVVVKKVPVLGTGKVDYVSLNRDIDSFLNK